LYRHYAYKFMLFFICFSECLRKEQTSVCSFARVALYMV